MKKMVKMGIKLIASGLLFILAGVMMLLFQVGIEGILIAIPIAIIILGGTFALSGIVMIIARPFARKGSDFAKEIADNDKEIDILEDDERNIAISNRTLAATFNYMNWLNPPLLIFLIVMQVELVVTLVFLVVMVAQVFVYTHLRKKYDKEM